MTANTGAAAEVTVTVVEGSDTVRYATTRICTTAPAHPVEEAGHPIFYMKVQKLYRQPVEMAAVHRIVVMMEAALRREVTEEAAQR